MGRTRLAWFQPILGVTGFTLRLRQELSYLILQYIFSDSRDRLIWDLGPGYEFLVFDVRRRINDVSLPYVNLVTKWIKYLPRTVNIFISWCQLNMLPMQRNLASKGIDIL